MNAPPKFAERLLRWSLPDEDRDVVLGDLQEEFGALAAEAGVAHAQRWYRQQTLLSVGPNLARRTRRQFDERRRFETDEDRQARRKARKWGLLMLIVGVPGVVWSDEAFPWVVALYVALFGVTVFLGSFFARPPLNEFARGIARRRNNMFWAFYWVAVFPDHIVGRTPSVVHLEMVALLLGVSVWFWPEKYWVFGSDVPYADPQVWTPFIGSGRRAPDGSFRLTVDAPRGGASIGDPIVVRAGDPRIRIDHVYATHDSLRVFAVVGEGAEPPRVTVEVLESSGVVKMSVLAHLQPADLVPARVPTRPLRTRLAQVDEVVNLSGLLPGKYQLRLTVADSERHSEKFADFRVAER